MSLSGSYSKRGRKHEDVLSATHALDKAAMVGPAPSLKINLPADFAPTPVLAPWVALENGQLPITFRERGQPALESIGSFTQWLDECEASRKLRWVKNGYDRKGKQRYVGVPYDSPPIKRRTVSLSSWVTELLSVHATRKDLFDYAVFLAARYEELTGKPVLAVNAHGDTDNLHHNLAEVIRDENGVPYPSVIGGAWTLGDGAAILLRYEAENFPVNSVKLNEIKDVVRMNQGKPGFRHFWDLELGLSADAWWRRWAISKGLVGELDSRRLRFESAAKKTQELAIQLKNFETGDASLLPTKTLRRVEKIVQAQATRIEELEMENSKLRKASSPEHEPREELRTRVAQTR